MQLRKVMLGVQEAGSTGTGAVHEYWGLSPQRGSFILLHGKVEFLISWVIDAWPCPVLRVMQSIQTLLLSAFWSEKIFFPL